MAAGLGTRLRPLTNDTPKPLVKLCDRPIVEYMLDRLALAGIPEALINVHYLPEKMRDFVAVWNVRGGVPLLHVQDEAKEILGSGGAVALGARWLFEHESAALICNSDVIATPDLQALMSTHLRLRAERGVECTLTVMKHPEAGVKYTGLRLENELVVGFERGAHDPSLRQFPGFYVIEKAAMARLPKAGASFSIMDELWGKLAPEGKLGAWEYEGPYFDLGTVEDLRSAEKVLGK
jgi:NDP-sugar pyrophosphorylase family protein